jgi:GAF domain-containing protein
MGVSLLLASGRHLVTPILNVGEQLGVLSLYSQNGHQKHQQIESFRKSKQMLLLRIVEHYALSLTNLRLREKLRLDSIRDFSHRLI